MEGIIAIVSIIWGVLSIILFFKIWKMTEDVARLTQLVEKIAEPQMREINTKVVAKELNTSESDKKKVEEKIIGGIKKGDIVKLHKSGTIYKVIGFTESNGVACKRLNQNILEKALNFFTIYEIDELDKVEE